jgi:hypothetical protein
MRGIKNQLIGQRFGLLTVYAEAISHNGRNFWRCRCDCGRDCIREGHELLRPVMRKRSWTHSCGCRKQAAIEIGRMLGNPGRIAGHPEHRHHRGQGKRIT